MINKKLLYEQPDCELLVVRFEGNIMSGFGNPDQAGDKRDQRIIDEEY